MTPDEHSLLLRFLNDLSQARGVAKDPEAASLINQVVSANPDAVYVLVQHSIMADQGLHAAQARIAELEAQLRAATPQPQSSFLGGASMFSQPQYAPTSVPSTPAPSPAYAQPAQPAPQSGFGSFLRNVGTTAAGVAAGEVLFSGISGLFGGGHQGGFGGGFGGGGGVENVTINEYNDYSDDNDGGDDGNYDDNN